MSAKVNSKTTLYEGRIFKLLRENVTLNNGVTVDLDVIHHPGASAMIPMSGNDNVILIKQYRHALRDFIWEIPAGTLEPNETPLACAKRELIEEIGFSANTWQKFTIPLTNDAFGTDAKTFQFILSNVQQFRIRTEMYNGDDVGAIIVLTTGRTWTASPPRWYDPAAYRAVEFTAPRWFADGFRWKPSGSYRYLVMEKRRGDTGENPPP